MRDRINLKQLLNEKLVGATLISLEYGFETDEVKAKEEGERYMPLPAKITSVHLGSAHKDALIYFEFDGHEDGPADDEGFYAYANEGIEYEV